MVFKDNKEPAFAGLKMLQSIGACASFLTAEYLCARTKICLLMALLIWAVAGICLLKTFNKKRDKVKVRETPTETTPQVRDLLRNGSALHCEVVRPF